MNCKALSVACLGLVSAVANAGDDLKIVSRWQNRWDQGVVVTYVKDDFTRSENCSGLTEAKTCRGFDGASIQKHGSPIAFYMEHLGWYLPEDGDKAGSPALLQPTPSRPAERGVIRVSVTSIDTGERQAILGYTARHVVTTETLDMSHSKCTLQELAHSYDGWYVDPPYEFAEPGATPDPALIRLRAAPSCNDQVEIERAGPAPGFALKESESCLSVNCPSKLPIHRACSTEIP